MLCRPEMDLHLPSIKKVVKAQLLQPINNYNLIPD